MTERPTLSAGIDLAFARDSSALVIASRGADGVCLVVEIEEVRGGSASDPRVVVAAFADALARHHVTSVMADVHYRDLLAAELGERGIALTPAPARPVESYLHARREMAAGRVQVPPHPLRRRLAQQLRDTQGKPLASGDMTILHGRRGGAHGDIVSALVLAIWQLRDVGAEGVLRVPARSATLTAQRGWAETPEDADERDDIEELRGESERWGELPDRHLDVW